jgi:DNA-binding transcriptional MocR family regulator
MGAKAKHFNRRAKLQTEKRISSSSSSKTKRHLHTKRDRKMIKMGIDADRLYSVAEVAKILNVARSTMERYIRQSPIEYINLSSGRQYTAVRILGSTLIDFLEKSIVTVERKPLYETKAGENSFFRGMPGRC